MFVRTVFFCFLSFLVGLGCYAAYKHSNLQPVWKDFMKYLVKMSAAFFILFVLGYFSEVQTYKNCIANNYTFIVNDIEQETAPDLIEIQAGYKLTFDHINHIVFISNK